MKKTLIAVTVSSLIIVSSQAQSFYVSGPMLIGGIIGNNVNTGGNRARIEMESRNNAAKFQYLVDLQEDMDKEDFAEWYSRGAPQGEPPCRGRSIFW